MKTTTSPVHSAPIASQRAFSRPAAMIGGALGLVALTAVATSLALRAPAPADAAPRAGSSTPLMASIAARTVPQAPTDFPEQMSPPSSTAPERAGPATKPVHSQRGTVKTAEARKASVCSSCGRVESVAALKHKGEGTGLGVVGGAVVGGLLGSQVGGGSGKNVATVLGVVGGGVAGNEVVRRARTTTVYQVHVRMDDGSLRTVTQSTAPTVGQKVTVEGSNLRVRASTS